MTQLNGISFSGLLEFVQVDLRPWGDQLYSFVNDTSWSLSRVWQGKTWTPLTFVSSGWQRGGENLVRPRITIPDFDAALWITLNNYDGAPGATVHRFEAMYDDILANNPQAVFKHEQYILNTVRRNGLELEVELATHIDFQQKKCPSFLMTRDFYPGLGVQIQR